MSSTLFLTVPKTATAAVDASAENGAQISRGGNLDSQSFTDAEILAHSLNGKDFAASSDLTQLGEKQAARPSCDNKLRDFFFYFFLYSFFLFSSFSFPLFSFAFFFCLLSIGGLLEVARGLQPLKIDYSPFLVTGIKCDKNTCLYDSFCSIFGRITTVFILGIKPSTSKLTRMQVHTLSLMLNAKGIKLFWSYSNTRGFGHLSATPFPGAKLGISLHSLLTHSFFGDNDGPQATSSYISPAIPALGGVRMSLSQLPATAISNAINTRWSPTFFPRQMVANKIRWDMNEQRGQFVSLRKNDFLRSFPQFSTRARLPALFDVDLSSIHLFKPQVNKDHILPVSYERRWERVPIMRALQPAFGGLMAVLEGEISKDALNAADQVVAVNRFLDTRGNRQVERWEAEQWPRWLALAGFANWSRSRTSYREAAYRLWSRYLFARTAESLSKSKDGVTTRVVRQGTNIQLTFINAVPVQGPNAPNPEGAMWTDDAQNGLKDGTKQFVDAQGLSQDELVELLSALVPLEDENSIPYVHINGEAEGDGYIPPHARYTFANGTNEIFIHFGNRPIPGQNTRQAISDAIFQPPKATQISSVLRTLAVRHGAADDIDLALQMVLFRSVGYSTDLIPHRANVSSNEIFHADGNHELFSAVNYTAGAYFDTLRVPASQSDDMQLALASTADELLSNGILMCHARAVSLAWAAFATSMAGRTWANRPGNENNQFVSNHIDVWLRTYGMENINIWSTIHANAMGFMYGFAPSQELRSTEALFVLNFWDNHQTPYIVNHYLELWMAEIMPTFMVLPYNDDAETSHPTWEEGAALPVSDYVSFQGDVQLGRDLKPFAGRTWLGDGGYTRNAQFYAAQGVNDVFRFEGQTPNFNLAFWSHQLVHQFPQNPAGLAPTWMDNQGSPFADFLLPGSISTVVLDRNRTYAYGLQLNQAVPANDPIRQRWYALSQQQAHYSLMVNYVHPLRQKREIETLEDYSVLIWEEGNRFAGMSVVRYDLPSGDAGLRFTPNSIPMPTSTGLPTAAGSYKQPVNGQRTTARRAFGPDDTSKRLNERLRPQRVEVPEPTPVGQFQYESKYPLTEEQLPKMDTYGVEMNEAGISVKGKEREWIEPHLRSGPEVSRAEEAMRKYQQRAFEADQAYEDWLAEEKQRSADKRASYQMGERSIRERVANRERPRTPVNRPRHQPGHYSAAVQSNTRARGPTPIRAQVQAKAPNGFKPTSVQPNDAPAATAQASLLDHQAALQRSIDLNNRLARPHSPRPQRPRASSLPPRPEPVVPIQPPPKPFEELAQRVAFEHTMPTHDLHADAGDGDAYIPSFEEVEGLGQPENSSGTW
jgi:hypothetical protein